VFVLFYEQVAALGGLIPRPSSPTNCVKDQETKKATKAKQKDVEPK
jgi:hypothetical protein